MQFVIGNTGGLKGEKSLNTLTWLLLTLMLLGALTLLLVPTLLVKPSRKPLRRRLSQDFETTGELGIFHEDEPGCDLENIIRSWVRFQGKLTALVRSPSSLYVYWEGREWPEGQQVLRLYQMNGHPQEKQLLGEVPLYGETDNWNFRDLNSNSCYWVELGLLSGLGEYSLLLTSERVVTPRDMVSTTIDPQWQPLAGLNFGFGGNVQPLSSNSLRKE